VLVLRELEGMTYREIASVIGAPIGTVMSRLARGREQLRSVLTAHRKKEA
jgi:RNA polymerase sigma-70 factor (ECF subfamily)